MPAPINTLLMEYANLHINKNEVYMVDTAALEAAAGHTGAFIDLVEDFQSACVFFAPACTISKAYTPLLGNAGGATELSTDANSNNAVDILFSKRNFISLDWLKIPTAVKFNKCFMNAGVLDDDSTFAYRTALHEGGHALGTSGFDPSRGGLYIPAHPNISDSVMNYETEPDCSPHPFDTMAILCLVPESGASALTGPLHYDSYPETP